MIFRAIFSAAEQDDVVLPVLSFSGRQKNGARSTWTLVCRFQDAEDIEARVPGRVAVSAITGGLEYPIFDDPIVSVTPQEGVDSRKINVGAEGQTTWLPAENPWDLAGRVTYRAPNRTDGKWSYRLAGPILSMRPGDTATYGDHTFYIGALIWQATPSAISIELAEA